MEISRLQGFDFVLQYDFYVCLCGISIAIRHYTTQLALSGIWKLLRSAKTNVSKIAICVSGKRSRAPHTELLKRELRVRQGRRLRRSKCRRSRRAFSTVNGRIVLLGLLDERT